MFFEWVDNYDSPTSRYSRLEDGYKKADIVMKAFSYDNRQSWCGGHPAPIVLHVFTTALISWHNEEEG